MSISLLTFHVSCRAGILSPSEPIKCQGGYYFESSHAEPRCDPISAADEGFCVNSCSPCDVLYSHAGDVTPNPTDCSSFFVCLEGGVLLESPCVEGPYYDYRTGFCQDDAAKCFNQCDPCETYCTTIGNVADPLDCYGFYQCSPPDLVHYECPVGEVFNPLTGVCSTSAICDETCTTSLSPQIWCWLSWLLNITFLTIDKFPFQIITMLGCEVNTFYCVFCNSLSELPRENYFVRSIFS